MGQRPPQAVQRDAQVTLPTEVAAAVHRRRQSAKQSAEILDNDVWSQGALGLGPHHQLAQDALVAQPGGPEGSVIFMARADDRVADGRIAFQHREIAAERSIQRVPTALLFPRRGGRGGHLLEAPCDQSQR